MPILDDIDIANALGVTHWSSLTNGQIVDAKSIALATLKESKRQLEDLNNKSGGVHGIGGTLWQQFWKEVIQEP